MDFSEEQYLIVGSKTKFKTWQGSCVSTNTLIESRPLNRDKQLITIKELKMKQKILSANHCGWCGLWSGSLNAAGDCLTCAASVVYWGWWANSVAEGNHGGITVVSHDVHSLQVAGG